MSNEIKYLDDYRFLKKEDRSAFEKGVTNPKAFGERLSAVVDAYKHDENGRGCAGLARAIGRSEGVVRKWIRGESEPRRRELVLIALEVGIDLYWLMTGAVPESLQSAMDQGDKEPAGVIPELLMAVAQALEIVQGDLYLALPYDERMLMAVPIHNYISVLSEDVEKLAKLRPDELTGLVRLFLDVRPPE